jgi:hypothetical protein
MPNNYAWKLLSALLITLPLAAQTDRAAISGTISDPSGAYVADAKIEAVSTTTGLRRATETGISGTYLIPGLPIGVYRVTISKEGFKPLIIDNADLQVGQARTIDARLEVGSVADSVEVTATAEAVNRTSAEIGGVVESEQIRDIPVSGRNWATLMLLAPGAVNTGDGAQRSIRFNGRSLDDNNFTFDGIDTSGIQEQTQKADTRLNISLESIAEFRVSSAVYTAERGAAGGAQVEVVSKTGTNQFHGGAFEALRNDALDSRSPFDDSQIPPFRLNQFGAQLGGPVIKDRAFFYANYEGFRQRLGQTMIGFVPNAAFRSQVIAASPALKPLIDAFPTGQTPIDDITDQITIVRSNSIREDSGMFRFDYRFSDATTMFARYNVDNALIDNLNDALGSRNVIPHVPSNFVLELQHTFSPYLLNETRFGVNRANYHNWNYGNAPLDVTISGFDGLTGNSLDSEVGTTFSYIDNLVLTRGRHTFKAGVDIRRIRLNNSGNTITTSSIDYATPQDFISNSADQMTYLEGEGIRGDRRTFLMGYAQDEFRPTANLTLNLGLRYEFYTVAHEILNRAAVVDIAGCGGFCPKGTPFYDPNPRDFGPRLGLAWAPAALGGKTVIRSGFGIYYGANQNDDFSDPLESAVPRYTVTVADAPNLSYPITPFLQPQYQFYSPKAVDRHRKDLAYENWDFVLQQQLPSGFVAQAGYVGSEGHHLFSKYQVNLVDPATGVRPLPQFSQFGFKTNDGNSNFHALQASLQRRFTNGWLWQTQYMWSHSITDASVGAGESVSFQNMQCRACDRSDSPNDVRHTITINSVYDLPFGRGRRYLTNGLIGKVVGGWDLSGIASASTGRPVNITIKRKASQVLDGNTSSQRPDLVPGVSIYPAGGSTVNDWFNPDAFAVPAKGTWGNLGRNIARGPGYYEIDTALQKSIPVSEHAGLSFRASAFNLFNHPAFGDPASNFSSPASFGRITGVLNEGAVGTGAPRRVEFMLRATF